MRFGIYMFLITDDIYRYIKLYYSKFPISKINGNINNAVSNQNFSVENNLLFLYLILLYNLN
jgi:hypothetical protein